MGVMSVAPRQSMAGVTDYGDVDKTFTHRDGGVSNFPSKNFGNDVIYEVFVDRFANGNTSNDCLWESRYCSPARDDWFKYWGGDLRGLIDRLPYLKRLGVNRIWTTPIFDNEPVAVERKRYGQKVEVSSFHGYWIRDWFRLNPAFTDKGSEDFALVDELIGKASPQIKIILDTVVNHTSPVDPTEASHAWLSSVEPLSGEDGIPRNHRGLLLRNGQYVTSYDEDLYRTNNQTGYSPRYHHYPTIWNWEDPFQLEYYSLENLADVSQDNVIMNSYMRDAHRFWLNRFPGLAGYRMDTIKHVGLPYWKEFSRDLFTQFPQTTVFGEDFGAGPLNGKSHPFYRETRMSLFDFSFRYTLADMLLYGKSFKLLGELWANDPRMIDARELVTFLDNHDIPRMRGIGMTQARMKQAPGGFRVSITESSRTCSFPMIPVILTIDP
jgi:cyclomaltodextrin glucanotransferase